MESQPSARVVGRLAGLLLVAGGVLSAATLPLPQTVDTDRTVVLTLSILAVAIGVGAFVAPWHRWRPGSSLVLMPVAFALISAGNYYANAQPYTYGVFFIVAFVWLGLGHPRWTSLWLLGPATAAYVAPLILHPHALGPAPWSAAVVIPVCGIVAESIAWTRQREQRSRERSAALARVALALGPHLNVEDLGGTLAGEMQAILHAERAVFFLVRDGAIEKVHSAGFSPQEEETLASLQGTALAGEPGVDELTRGEPIVVSDPTSTPTLLRDPSQFGMRSYVAVPVVVEDELRGILASAEQTRTRRYRPDDIQSAQALAAQASAALRNALLYERTLEASRSDELTELGNRRAFHDQLEAEVERARRYGRKLSLVVIDVDELKAVNDASGHLAGDEVLRRVGRLLRTGSRRSDGVYRIGGDEFAVVLPETSLDNAAIVAERIRLRVERDRVARDAERDLTVSIGVSSFPDHGINADELFERADNALYQVKRAGRNAVCTATTREPAGPGVRFGIDVNAVIDDRRIEPRYQPLVDLASGDVFAYEAFCHLDPSFASAPTSTLFRAAASLGLTEPLDRVCRTMALDGARGLHADTLLFLNVSPGALASPEFDISEFVAAIRRAGIGPGQVVVDVTDHERTLGPLLVRNLASCQEAGLRLSLDDFGDTTSDLNVLASLPFDFVKIDMGVIRGDEELRRRLILGLLVVAREIGARLLAEGVETVEELRLVTELGFEAAQGFYIKDPAPPPLLPKHVDLLPAG